MFIFSSFLGSPVDLVTGLLYYGRSGPRRHPNQRTRKPGLPIKVTEKERLSQETIIQIDKSRPGLTINLR